MKKYQRPLIALAAALTVSSLMSACVVVPARGYYRGHYRYYGAATTTAPVAQATVTTPQG
jgi:SAM-dependent MidA family methyltransferase